MTKVLQICLFFLMQVSLNIGTQMVKKDSNAET